MRRKVLDRLFLLGTASLAAYQVAIGIEGMARLAIASYSVGFGLLLLAAVLLIILGFEVLDSSLVLILSTMIPLSLSLGLVAQLYPSAGDAYFLFSLIGLLAVAITRYSDTRPLSTMVLIIVHAVAGLLIFGLPLHSYLIGRVPLAFTMVSVGGALIGIGGILLSFLKVGRPILSRTAIMSILPALLLLTTLAFVAGFSLS